jgi:transcriptional regulator GlxA family with amidase domain
VKVGFWPDMQPKEIGFVGFDNATGSHLTAAADAFAAAWLEDGFGGRIPCYRVWTIGLTKEHFVTESGFIIYPQKTLATAPPLDTIVIAGGSGARRPEVSAQVGAWILGRAYETRRIASIGAGIHALAPTALLDGREVTTDWRFARTLARRYPTLRIDHKRRLVKDGPFYTAAGLTAGVDLALAMIEEDYGKQVALSVNRELMTYLAPTPVPNESIRPWDYDSQPIDRFGDLVAWVMRNLDQNVTVDALAKQAGMCPAHFTRAFKSVFGSAPGEFVENLRLNEARRRLSSRGKTLRSVAASVGFRDPTAFRRAFARRFGTGPGNYANGKEAISITSRPKPSKAA